VKEFQDINGDIEKNTKIREYSTLLYYLYDTLSILLTNLLSSHVDNYRDNSVIDSTVNLLICLMNYLYEIYSYNKGFMIDSVNYNVYVVDYVQKLFEVALRAFKEICKFNNTIKLNFEKILEKVSEKPSNKGPMIYLLSFMFYIVNNEYTVETFIENMTKVYSLPVIDVFNEIENNLKHQTIRLGHLSTDRNFLQYLIEIGVGSNNEWIVSTCSDLILSVMRCYYNNMKVKVYEQICDNILDTIKATFTKISKVNSTVLEDKVIIINLGN
jgi:hypothetical protein